MSALHDVEYTAAYRKMKREWHSLPHDRKNQAEFNMKWFVDEAKKMGEFHHD